MDWMGTLNKLQGGGQQAPAPGQPGMGTGNVPFAPGMMTGFGQTPDAPARGAGGAQGLPGGPPVQSPSVAARGPQRAVSGPSGAMAQSGGPGGQQATVGAYTPQQQMQVVETIMQALLARSQASEQQRRMMYRGGR